MNEQKWSLVVAQETTNAVAVFSESDVDKILGDIEEEVASIVPDLETIKGRKEIASLAHKVSRSKVALDNLGRDLVSDWKTQAKAVDASRKKIRDRLDALRDQVRQPLTEWEAAEKLREDKIKLEKEVSEAFELALIEDDLINRALEIERKEEQIRVQAAEKAAQEALEQAEEDRVRHEAALVLEAEERAKKAAQQQAEADRKEDQEKIIKARLAEERAVQATKDAEARRIKDLADQKEQMRIEQQEIEEAARVKAHEERLEQERKASNKRHQGAVNRAILKSVMALGISEEHAKAMISSAAKGEIPNLKITY